MGLAFAAGKAWGGMGPLSKALTVAGMGLLLSAPYLASQYHEYSTAKAAESARLASAERVKQRLEVERARVAALTPEQRAAEQVAATQRAQEEKDRAGALARAQADAEAGKAKRQMRLQLATRAAKQLRAAMKDPEAFVLTGAVLTPDGSVCYSYRAKNTFGATLPSSAMLRANGALLLQERDGNSFIATWNKECTSPGAENITHLVKNTL